MLVSKCTCTHVLSSYPVHLKCFLTANMDMLQPSPSIANKLAINIHRFSKLAVARRNSSALSSIFARYFLWESLNSCLFISGVFFYFWSEIFTLNNRKMHTFDLLIVKGDTLRLLIVKYVSYD